MKNRMTLAAIAAAGAGGFVGGFAVGRLSSPALATPASGGGATLVVYQPEDGGVPEGMDPAMQKMVDAGEPGEHHQKLDTFVGTWDAAVSFRMGADGEWIESTGTVTREWILDGRFMREDVDAAAMGMPYKAMGILGYNNLDGRYEMAWFENASTAMMTETAHITGDKMLARGSHRNPITGLLMDSRSVIDMSNPDRHTAEGYTFGPDGKEYMSFKGVFERRK